MSSPIFVTAGARSFILQFIIFVRFAFFVKSFNPLGKQ